MMMRTLVLLVLVISQLGCVFEFEDRYRTTELPEDARQRFERSKGDFLKIEDIKVGTGSLAAWNRRISADLEIRYTDGTLVYKGPVFSLIGFYGIPGGGIYDPKNLGSNQNGIRLGLNGMSVGGRRKITVDKSLVCTDLPEQADPRATCDLIGYALVTPVRKEQLVVEATLTASCIPVKLAANIWYIGFNIDIRCREENTPVRNPSDPIWRFYG